MIAAVLAFAAIAVNLWAAITSARTTPRAEGIRRFGPILIASAAVAAVGFQTAHLYIASGIWAAVTVLRAIEWWRNRPPRPPRRRRSLATATP